MKNFCVSMTLTVIALIVASTSYAGNPLVGVLQPASNERIAVLTGDRALVNLGTKHGLLKGDVGIVTSNGTNSPDAVVGKCSITSAGFDSSICEVTKAKREIEKGDYVLFDPMSFSDGNYYSIAMNTLAAALEPYEPYVRLNVCIYGFYDSGNSITGLSEQITKEFKNIFMQKPQVQLIDRSALKDLVIYPDLPGDLLAFTRSEMQQSGVDVLILGSYVIADGQVQVTVRKLGKAANDRTLGFTFATQPKYVELASKVILTPQEMTKSRSIPCNLVLRTTPQLLNREERAQLITTEAAGNPVLQQTLRGLDFNIVSPLEITATIDQQVMYPTKKGTALMLSTGTHAMSASFKRGYFFNETLLYTSEQAVTKQAVLDLSKEKGLVIELGINASQLQDPLVLTIYHPTHRQHQVLKPIYGVESEKQIETFKD
jgi:hypothetical protein